MIELLIHGKVPSKKNSKRRVKRGQGIFMIPSAAHEAWHARALAELRPQWDGRAAVSGECTVSIDFVPGDRRAADLSNKAESVMDLLVDAGILADDNWFVVAQLILRAHPVDKEKPSARVTIIPFRP